MLQKQNEVTVETITCWVSQSESLLRDLCSPSTVNQGKQILAASVKSMEASARSQVNRGELDLSLRLSLRDSSWIESGIAFRLKSSCHGTLEAADEYWQTMWPFVVSMGVCVWGGGAADIYFGYFWSGNGILDNFLNPTNTSSNEDKESLDLVKALLSPEPKIAKAD